MKLPYYSNFGQYYNVLKDNPVSNYCVATAFTVLGKSNGTERDYILIYKSLFEIFYHLIIALVYNSGWKNKSLSKIK